MKIKINFKDLKENPDLLNEEINKEKKKEPLKLNNDYVKFNPSFKKFTEKTIKGIFLRLVGCQTRIEDLKNDLFYQEIMQNIEFSDTSPVKNNKNIQNILFHKKKMSGKQSSFVGIIRNDWKNTKNDALTFLVKFIENVKCDLNNIFLTYEEINSLNYIDYDEKNYYLTICNLQTKYFNFDKNHLKDNEEKIINLKEKYNDLANELSKKYKKFFEPLKNSSEIEEKFLGILITYAMRLYCLNNEYCNHEDILESKNGTSVKGIAPATGYVTYRELLSTNGINNFKTSGPFVVMSSDGILELEVIPKNKNILNIIEELIKIYDIKNVPIGHGIGKVVEVISGE